MSRAGGVPETVDIKSRKVCNQWNHDQFSSVYLIVRVVRQVGGAVKEVADAMPAVASHDLEALLTHMVADDVTHLPVPHPWLHCIDRLLERLHHTSITITFNILAQEDSCSTCLHHSLSRYPYSQIYPSDKLQATC